MPMFKRLTRATEKGEEIDVNMDTVTHMQQFTDHTTIHFAVAYGDGVLTLLVRQTPDQIHLINPLPSAR
jgi:hypothetical protein